MSHYGKTKVSARRKGVIIIGSECARNGRNKELGVFIKTKKAMKTRVYSVSSRKKMVDEMLF